MTHQDKKIDEIRKRAKHGRFPCQDVSASEFNISTLRTNCIRVLDDGDAIMQINPLALFFLIDKIEQLENNLKALKNELKQIELLSDE